MRNSIKIFSIVLFGATLVSCAQELLPVNDTPEVPTAENPTTHTILIKAAHDNNTRTQIGAASGNLYASLWSEGDRLAVYQSYPYGKDGYKEMIQKSAVGVSSDGGQTMVFSVDFDPVELDSEEYMFTYRAAYPNASLSNYYSGTMIVTLPRTQFPTATSFDPQADILISRPIEVPEQPDELNFVFKRHSALAQMTLNGVPEGVPQNAVIHNVVFYSSIPLSGEKWMPSYMEGDEEWNTWDSNAFSRSIVMDYSGKNLSPFSPNGVKAQFMCMPGVLSAEEDDYFTVVVTLDVNGSFWGGYVREVEFTDDRELVFSEGGITGFSVDMSEAGVEQFPPFTLEFTEETLETSPELADGKLNIPSAVNNSAPKNADGDGRVYIEFETMYPWSVYFSEPWLGASNTSGYGDGGFQLYAEANETGQPRQATMTIASDYGGKFEYTVTQASIHRSVYIANAPSCVLPYNPFVVEYGIDSDDPNDIWDTHYDYYVEDEDMIVKWSDNGLVALTPGKLYVYAYYYNSSSEVYLYSDPVEITCTEPAAPSDWYFLIRRDDKPYLIHRVGSSDTFIELSDNVLAQANEMAFSANGSTVYVVGAVPGENDALIPCLWTYDGSTASRTDYSDYPNLIATDLAIDNSDVHILVSDPNPAGSKDFLVLTNGQQNGRYTLASYEGAYNLTDITAEGGKYYLCGANMRNYENYDSPYYWKNLTISSTHYAWPLMKHNLGNSNLSDPRYYPESIAVKDGVPYVVGCVRFKSTDFYLYRRALYWQGEDDAPDYLGPQIMNESTAGTYYMFHAIAKINGNFVLVGEVYQDHNSYKDNWSPLLFYNNFYTSIPLEYSSAMAGLNDVCLYNGVPALGGTLVDAENNPHPAFWEAPWREPFVWGNTTDTIVDFLVK